MRASLPTILLLTIAASTLGAAPASSPTMPPGHPSMSDLLGTPMPSTQPAVKGSLTVQLIPGTAGGVIAPAETVTVDLIHRGASLKKLTDLKPDADGKLTLPDLPVMPPVQPLISITHGGLLQQILGPELNSDTPIQSIQMKVFDTTDQQPAWSITMQHMILQWATDGTGVRVVEMLSINTAGDRAWLGAKTGDQRITMSVPLPPGADQIELAGNFDEDASRLVDGNLITGSALFPGRNQFQLTYTVPAKNGALDLPIAAPANAGTVDNLRVFLPADDVQVKATGLSGGDAIDMGEGKIRMFQAQNLKAGAVASLSIRGIKAEAADSADTTVAPTSRFSARNVALGGAFLLVLAGAGMMMVKKPRRKTDAGLPIESARKARRA